MEDSEMNGSGHAHLHSRQAQEDEAISQRLADKATTEMARHLDRWTPESLRPYIADKALDAVRTPLVLHHFRLMRMSTLQAEDPDKAFAQLVRTMGGFCTADETNPGLAQVISGLCENVFDPLVPWYDQEHHKRAVQLLAPQWKHTPSANTNIGLGDSAPSDGNSEPVNTDEPSAGKGGTSDLNTVEGGMGEGGTGDVDMADANTGEGDKAADGSDTGDADMADAGTGKGGKADDIKTIVDGTGKDGKTGNRSKRRRTNKATDDTNMTDDDVGEDGPGDECTSEDDETDDRRKRRKTADELAETTTFAISNEFDVTSVQYLAGEMKNALVTDIFDFRKKNQEKKGRLSGEEAERIVKFMFHNVGNLPLLLQHILQQLHGVSGKNVVGQVNTAADDTVPPVVRDFAVNWLRRTHLEKRSALLQVQRVVMLCNLHSLFEQFVDGLTDREGKPGNLQWQVWTRVRSGQHRLTGANEGIPLAPKGTLAPCPPERGLTWRSMAKKALMTELKISDADWTSATREWRFITPFVETFGPGIIPFFTGDTRFSIKSFKYASMIPDIVHTIKDADQSNGRPLGQIFDWVGVLMGRIVWAMSADGSEFQSRLRHIPRPVGDEGVLARDRLLCDRMAFFGLLNLDDDDG